MRRLPLLPTLVVAAAVATMIALGIWQLRRAEWKERLLADYAAPRACRRSISIRCSTGRGRCRRSPSAARSSPATRATCGARSCAPAAASADQVGQVYLVPCRPGADGLAGRLSVNAGWAPRPDDAPAPDARRHRRRPARRGRGGRADHRSPPPRAAPPLAAQRARRGSSAIPNNHRLYAFHGSSSRSPRP